MSGGTFSVDTRATVPPSRTLRDVALTALLAAAVSALWIVSIPPFEKIACAKNSSSDA